MTDFQNHLDAEDLERYSLSTGSEENEALVEEHLLICEACRGRLQEAEAYLVTMRVAAEQVRRGERTGERQHWSFPVWLPALATAACLLLMVFTSFHFLQAPAPEVAVSLTALRGSGFGSNAPAGRQLVLRPDLNGLPEIPSYRLQIVDQAGRTLHENTLRQGQGSVRVPSLRAGLYFVRVYRPAGELLREYGVEIQ